MQCHTNVVSVFEELDPQPAFFRPSPSPSTVGGLAGAAVAALAGDASNGHAAAAVAEGDSNGSTSAAEAGAAGTATTAGDEAAAAEPQLHYTPLPLGNGAGSRSLKSEKLEGMRLVVVLAVVVTGVLYSCVGECCSSWPHAHACFASARASIRAALLVCAVPLLYGQVLGATSGAELAASTP